MKQADQEIERCLNLLRTKLKDQAFTQDEVQDAMSWGDSYVSQLLTKQKKLRVDQVLSILFVIGVEPREFYAELYDLQEGLSRNGGSDTAGSIEELQRELKEHRRLTRSLVKLLVKKKVVTAKEARQVA